VCLAEELKNDKEVVMAAVKRNGDSLKYASEELKNDKEVSMAAVRQRCQGRLALKYASEESKNDKEVAMAHLTASKQVKGTYSQNPMRWVNVENKTKITNKSYRDIEVFISHQEVEITFSAKGELCIGFCYVAKADGSFELTKKIAPRKPEGTVIVAGSTETFQLPQKDYYLTIMSSDPSKGAVVHEFNRRVLSKENWTFEQKDLNKMYLQSKAVFNNNSDRNMIVILSYNAVSASAAATKIRQMGTNTSEPEDYTATATQIFMILANTTESFNISEQSCFVTTASKDPVLGYILHESNRSVACKDGYSFTQDYLKKNVGSLTSKNIESLTSSVSIYLLSIGLIGLIGLLLLLLAPVGIQLMKRVLESFTTQ